MKILIIQLRQLGDILLTTPVISALKQHIDRSEIYFLSHSMGRMILDGNPDIKSTFYYRDDDTLKKSWHLIQTIRQHRFDYVIDFMNNPRSAMFTLLSGAAQNLSFSSRRSFLYKKVIPRDDPNWSEEPYIVEQKFRLLAPWTVATQEAYKHPMVIPFNHEQSQRPLTFWHDIKNQRATSIPGDAPKVVIAATHRRENRMWPLDHYAQLANVLVNTCGAHIVWLWGPGELPVAEQCKKLCPASTVIAPQTSFRELAALIANADLFIGNSNGPSHVSVAVGTPSLQLHGSTIASAWCPKTTLHQAIQSPTSLMSDITVNHVAKTCLEMISSKSYQNFRETFALAVQTSADARNRAKMCLHKNT